MVLIEKSKNKKHFVPSESLWLRVGPFPTDSRALVWGLFLQTPASTKNLCPTSIYQSLGTKPSGT